ncbi:T9SS type A sorting domain-containing protein [Gracilimonas mengyeensis]|nr:T9SS type A sorting domain-containing protein [Gracilimonas mengyeensis]
MGIFLLPVLIISGMMSLGSTAQAQTKQVENLDRGLIAIAQENGYLVSWRLLGNEAYDTGFNVYRDGEKLNEAPITGATLFTDTDGGEAPNYTVRAVVDGSEQTDSKPARLIKNTEGEHAGYFDIPLNRPQQGPEGGIYSPNDASVGDLNGDGQYEVVVKWNPSNAKDNSQAGKTDNVYLDAYTLDGAMLWRIDLGRNIRAGAHYTQFMVYDFDGSGKAELMVKTAPGTKDGNGNFLSKGPAASANHSADFRNSDGYILRGPEYLTVFDGETGAELATTEYVPVRGGTMQEDWGDSYGNRVDRFLAGVAYVDGEKPSAIFARGYYTRMVVVAWDWRNGELTQRWVFDTDDPEYGSSWEGQGNHQLSVADADNDGRHEIIYGSVVIDDDGSGLHNTGQGHGDALHVTQMVKGDPIPKIFMPHEWDQYGVSLRNADDGSMLFNNDKSGDIGRGAAAELDSEVPGFKFWASSGMGLYDMDGNVAGQIPSSINHVVWWDGELSRELLNSNRVTKWSVANNSGTTLLSGSGTASVNGTKSNPNLQADILGDWREEVLLRTTDNERLRVFTTTMPTDHRLYTFMHDPVYRTAIAWQNTAYNQPPHPGFYVASDMDFPLSTPDVEFAQEDISSCALTPITPFLKVGDGEFEATANAFVEFGATVSLAPQAEGEGSWSWTGPEGFTAEGREITLEELREEQGGSYFVRYTNACGSQTKFTFDIQVEPEPTEVRFAVDMEGQDTSRGVFLTGVIVNWDIVEMENVYGDIYTHVMEAEPGASGIYYYMTTGTWDNYEEYKEEIPITCTAFHTSGRGRGYNMGEEDMILAHKWSSCETFDYEMATSSESEISLPDEFTLRQNYPNPFNPSTVISYQLPVNSKVNLEVFDMSGRVVASLVDGRIQPAGTHAEVFEAADLASGMYIYQLKAGDFSMTKKLLLIK